MNINLGKKNNS